MARTVLLPEIVAITAAAPQPVTAVDGRAPTALPRLARLREADLTEEMKDDLIARTLHGAGSSADAAGPACRMPGQGRGDAEPVP